MSDDTTLPPPSIPIPAPEPSALKSLLNPIQSGAATPSSVIVEPPRSPQRPPQDIVPSIPPTPVNGIDTQMEEVAVPPPAPLAAETSSNGEPSLPPLPVDAPVPPSPTAADEPPPTLPADAIPPAVSTPSVITQEAAITPVEGTPQPPAIPDATPPPPPPVAEPAPAVQLQSPVVEAPTAIDPSPAPAPIPAEPTPIPTPAPGAEASAPSLNDPPTPVPAPSGLAEPAPTPVQATPAPTLPAESQIVPPPTKPAPTEAVQEPMELDEPVPSPSNGLKRSGDELEGGIEKRVKEESAAPAPLSDPASTTEVAPPAAAPVQESATPAPGVAGDALPAVAAPAPPAPTAGTIPLEIPPEPQPEGPTTPLTVAQRTHLQNALKNLKKSKDSLWFMSPVDFIALGIPHYPQYISKPMDLGTVETKLYVSDPRGPPKDKSRMSKWDESKGKYNNVAEVVLDVRQIWWNTARFNGKTHAVTEAAYRLDNTFNKALKNLPADIPATPVATPTAVAGPSTEIHARRPSVSQQPVIRRTSDVTDRPKREIHPPPSKELPYAEPSRKPKRRNDPQLQWAFRTIKSFEASTKTFDMVAPFLYDVNLLISGLADYSQIIKKPIDLNIIKSKIEEGVYDDFSQLDDDMKLMISNALTYNRPDDPVNIAAQQLQQLWTEKVKSLPSKTEARESSEDVAVASQYDDSDDDEDEGKIAEYEAQISDLKSKVDTLRAKVAKRKANKAKRPKKSGGGGAAGGPSRKGSTVKTSPGVSNGHAKKARKPKDISYRDDDGDDDDEVVNLTTSQKTDLAEKIQNADGSVLQKAITIIQKAQDVGSDGEIELDIDSLPPATVKELYILVVGPLKKARKSNYVPTGKKPGRKPGGPRKSMNEDMEAERIARMQAQLESFEGGRGGAAPANGGYGDDDSESSEEEESDLD